MPALTEKQIERFHSRYSEGPGCWEWKAYTQPHGYGQFSVGYHHFGAHRIAWQLAHGQEVPAGMEVDHLCYNRACVRPAHLHLTTHKQNLENRSGPTARSTSGIRGVRQIHNGRWVARVQSRGKTHHGGYYATKEEASAAVDLLRARLGFHDSKNLGITVD